MFATIELQKQAAADRYYHQLHLKPWAKSPEEAAWALMQRIMGLGQCDGRFYIGFHIVYGWRPPTQELETKIIFPLFRLFRGNGSWCRISRIQSPSHHIIFELKSSPQRFRSFIAHSAQDSTHFHECREFLISCHRISRIPRT